MVTQGQIETAKMVKRDMHVHTVALDALRVRRNNLIDQLHRDGMSERQIASLFEISPASVHEIRYRKVKA